MITPINSVLASSININLNQHANAAEQIADPENLNDPEGSDNLDAIVKMKRSKQAAEQAMAAMQRVNETAEHLLDIVV
ncbi:hypothetical protein [Roseiconus lacunae]|uniref:Flagellar basal-body/hook protein C-terminal domain-containing protein n=1 Tax=Roseiconus lacunae TaxID=2605694 RepID=A0ABT7PMA0_9BACT|nr:hypothetical protein [Roseiconus lacunae]MCD0461521.1 hypothetical protein [Roseiconus lacunae]MDM4017598.1 hypothetical protein [Roseiconus lacunae]WRQ51138.1 hypothetical protein U8335_01060 [Stieleria sp. HD01]